jgi:hypothetical protein
MVGGIVVAAAGLIASLLGGGVVGVPLLVAGVVMSLEAACAFLLGGKLVCLGHNECAVGKIVQVEPVGFDKSFPETIDNDYCINVLLAPHVEPVTEDTVRGDGGQGRLIAEQPAIDELGLGYAGYPHKNTALPASDPLYHIPVLHCEFEGGRVDNICSASKVAGPIAAAGLAFCAIPFIGWVACLIALIIALLILAVAWNTAHDGSADDALGDPEAGEVNVGQYVIVRGDWTYDAGHEDGWNELHPVTFVQRVQPLKRFDADGDELPPLHPPWQEGSDQATVAAFKLYLAEACEQTHKPYEPEVEDEQRDPPNRWCLHPVVDGCEPEPDDVPIPK